MQRYFPASGQLSSMRILLVLLISEVVILSCKKNAVAPASLGNVTLTHHQTRCADPWQSAYNDSLSLINVAHYLDSLMLYRTSLYIKEDASADPCTSCHCRTGKIIYVVTVHFDSLIQKYHQAGFQ